MTAWNWQNTLFTLYKVYTEKIKHLNQTTTFKVTKVITEKTGKLQYEWLSYCSLIQMPMLHNVLAQYTLCKI